MRAQIKRRLLALFQARRVLDDDAVRACAPTANYVLKQMIGAGYIEQREGALPHTLSAIESAITDVALPQLTPDQAAAVASLCADLSAFKPHLLLGVTGSGKTRSLSARH